MSDVLAAVQDLASGRDSFETSHVDPAKAIHLVDVRQGSGVYEINSHAPAEHALNLANAGVLLSGEENGESDEYAVAALRPVRSISEHAKTLNCRIEVAQDENSVPVVTVDKDSYERISRRLLLRGETSVIGTVNRVGGVTSMRCLLKGVPGRDRGLYCDVKGKDLVRRLGQCLYQQIVATGTAVWIHRTWRIHEFTIHDFTQPQIGNASEAIEQLRKAGLSAWDNVPDPEALIREMRE